MSILLGPPVYPFRHMPMFFLALYPTLGGVYVNEYLIVKKTHA